MSKTYRRKKGDQSDLEWHLTELVRIPGTYRWIHIPIKQGTQEYKKLVAEYHSDRYRHFKEPGPAWFRNLTTERPQRREVARQLHKYKMDPDYEVILNAKDPLDYWT